MESKSIYEMLIIFEIHHIHEIFNIIIQYFIQAKIIKSIYIIQIQYKYIIILLQTDNLLRQIINL